MKGQVVSYIKMSMMVSWTLNPKLQNTIISSVWRAWCLPRSSPRLFVRCGTTRSRQLQHQCSATRYEEKSCDDPEVSSWNGDVCIGQLTVHASGLNTLIRSYGVAAQEIQEGMTIQQYNEVILALAILYLTTLNAIVKIIQGRQLKYSRWVRDRALNSTNGVV